MELRDTQPVAITVGLLYEQDANGDALRAALDGAATQVVFATRFSDLGDAQGLKGIDVLVVSLETAAEDHLDQIADLIDEIGLPVVFNDSDWSSQLSGWDQARWARHLSAKVTGKLDTLPPRPDQGDTEPEPQSTATPADAPGEASTVWVLGASIGGPEAVRAFLAALPADVPAAFVLAQHMGSEFLDLMAEQLDRATALAVVCAEEGLELRRGQVVVAPTGQRLLVDDDRRIQLADLPAESPYNPCIDLVMEDLSARFGEHCGAIVFSGMARDGIRGSAAVAAAGGSVWAQDAESCVISSMADGAREAGVVEYSGTPQELAARLASMTIAGRAPA